MIIANPVLLKEMRQRFRGIKAPLILFIYLMVLGGFILGYMYLIRDRLLSFDPSESMGIFAMLSVLQLILLAFVTPGLTASTISGERERQTLNVLLTTELKPAGIVISKMISSCAFTLLLLIAALPLYSVILIYGGISPTQLWGVFAFYLVTMFLFGAVGMACSTFFQRASISTITSYGIMAFLGAGTAFLAAFINDAARDDAVYPQPEVIPFSVQFLQDINPVLVLAHILGGGPAFGPEADWILPYWAVYALFYLGVGVLLLVWSGYRLNPLRKK
ncbi:ABC-type transport system involved in multi-copper enzyme maturation permease subunit [Desulfohalotomaculum tongense]|uniref:ABC transporter permease n=1 Tax=Desulforadius tongensis TaxID=1216062 RepID=UPI001957A1DB|nr:ABC transporter permease [Desulforadius tongensis]MBM7856011.1 ABC-type transport system involved in multi-copper enzyme maturation permease subunit [Desulforadius tongensis]